MNWSLMYKIFDNNSVAALVGVLGASIPAIWTFWQQRNLTKADNASENIQLLLEKCEYVNLILDRISHTYLSIYKTKELKYRELFLESSKEEFSKISLIINDEIPQIRAKIKNYFNLYFSKNKTVIKNLNSFFEELKNWHANIIDIAFVGYEFECWMFS